MKPVLKDGANGVSSSSTSRVRRFSDLSAPRQALIRLCQSINYGQILGLAIDYGDPTFCPAPRVLIDVKLDSDEESRHELDLADFDLRLEICRLVAQLDSCPSGTIERIEIRAGIPRRVVFERRLPREIR